MNFFIPQIKLIFLYLLIPFSISLIAQDPVPVQKSDNKVTIEGKMYYIHVVKAGQTLYSISRAYGLKEDAIERENPGVMSGLRVSQVIKIPLNQPVLSTPPEIRDTSKFIYHTLVPGETLYFLTRKYEVSIQQIETANPGINSSTLSVGQVILIPRHQIIREKQEIAKEETEYDHHRVRRRETLYGISRNYGITVDELLKRNPVLQETGLKMWQVLNIPKIKKPEELEVMEIPADTAEVGSIDSIYSEFLNIEVENTDKGAQREINIAYLIPFNYSQETNESLAEMGADVVNPETIKKQPSAGSVESLTKPYAIPFLEFLEGSLLALDSLKKTGVSVNVKVFDTQRSPSRVKSIIASGDLDRMNMIIGPFFSYNVEILSKFSHERRIPLIVPFHDSDSLLLSNPYLFQVSPSARTELDALAEFAIRNPGNSILILCNNDPAEKVRVAYLRKKIGRAYAGSFPFGAPVIKEIVYDATAKTDLSSKLRELLSPEHPNLVIVPSIDEAFISMAVTQLFFQLKNFGIELLGMPQWSVYQNVDLLYLHKLNFRFLSPYYFSYNNPEIDNFLIKWRLLYGAEPTSITRKGCNYAFLGHDVTWHFIAAFKEYGRRFILHSEKFKTDLLMNSFEFQKNSYNSGFENKSFEIVKFNPDLSVNSEDFSFPAKKIPFVPEGVEK